MRPFFLRLLICLPLLALANQFSLLAQTTFGPLDSLRGTLGPDRSSYDVTFYGLHLKVSPSMKRIDGYVDIDFTVVEPTSSIRLDLDERLGIRGVSENGKDLDFRRCKAYPSTAMRVKGGSGSGPDPKCAGAFYVDFGRELKVGSQHTLKVEYGGPPKKAQNPPWDGGFVWALDNKDRSWVGVACEGEGASLWWPNKDHLSDEPDSALISITVPRNFMAVANGELRDTREDRGSREVTYDWFVSYPINNYNISLTVGRLTHFSDVYRAADGEELPLDYYVLDYNEHRAKKHFEQVKGVLEAYEHYFGKYPFWRDGYALIETPYLGMEHQSGIAYGNRYMRGYLGGMIPRGMDWDYIIVHETGHEYFGNSISVRDHGEMWIHESFTTYMEALYVEYHHGPEKATAYLNSQRPYLENRKPILGPLGVNYDGWGGSDHYYKGAWMLHTLRVAINDDPLWFGLLRSLYDRFQLSMVNTEDITTFINEYTGEDYSTFFDQYLRQAKLPILELRENRGMVEYRWNTEVADFNMPVDITVRGTAVRIQPTTYGWQPVSNEKCRISDVKVDMTLFTLEEQ